VTEVITSLSEPLSLIRRKLPLRLKVIRPVFETLKVKELPAGYLDEAFTSPGKVAEMLAFLKAESKEYFLALHLDNKNRLLCLDRVSVGSLSASIVHPREVFKSALLSSAAGLVLVHNHPSGQTDPSYEDKEVTSRLVKAGEMLGIHVLDHIILGDGFFSFAEQGLL
jgi:DNA repair protein RadC